jgi:hypothetical protein
MEENLCKIEILKEGNEYVARIFTETEGTREISRPTVEMLLRDLTVDLEYIFEGPSRGQEGTEL